MRCILIHVTQQELDSKKAHIDNMGTSKEAVMEGYPKCTNLIDASMYDTMPVHCISMVSEEFKWVIKEKQCFNVEMGKVEKLRFLRMNCTKKFNNKMGGVGIDDNPRNYYRIYFGARERKWWWYICFCAVVVILTNAYIIYICINNIHGNPRKNR